MGLQNQQHDTVPLLGTAAPPRLLTHPLSLRRPPLGPACVYTSTVNCSQRLLCFSLSFLSSRLRTTARESDSCFPRSSLTPMSPKDAHQAGMTGSSAIHPQGGTGQSDTLSTQPRHLRALLRFLCGKSFKYLVTILVRSQKTAHLMTAPAPSLHFLICKTELIIPPCLPGRFQGKLKMSRGWGWGELLGSQMSHQHQVRLLLRFWYTKST